LASTQTAHRSRSFGRLDMEGLEFACRQKQWHLGPRTNVAESYRISTCDLNNGVRFRKTLGPAR
jgi:hypothetical protein